jgi:hypothetical protein
VTNPEGSNPADTAEVKSSSSVVLRVALLCAVGICALLFFTKQNGSSAAESNRMEKNQAETWLHEVDAHLSRIACHYPDTKVAQARRQELPKSVERWEELARIEPSEYLKSLIRIQGLSACSVPDSTPLENVVQTASARLRENLARRVRTQYALLVRAQKQGERQDALRAINSLQVLLAPYEGPARIHLEKLARHFK